MSFSQRLNERKQCYSKFVNFVIIILNLKDVQKLTDNMESVKLSCPTLSGPHTSCSASDSADLGSIGPVCALGHGPFSLI